MAPRVKIENEATASPAPQVTPSQEPAAVVAAPVERPASKPRIIASSTVGGGSETVAKPASQPSVAPKVEAPATKVEAPSAKVERPVAQVSVASDDSWDFSWDEQDERDVAPVRERVEEPAASPAPTAEAAPERKRRSVQEWVRGTFPGHEFAFWGAIIALVVALLIFLIGFWRVLLIFVLVLVGIALGQVLDGDPKMIRAVRNLFPSDDGDR